ARMGSSAKKKREKKQDFQKTKLKVGKTKAKAANFTDTSFKAKSIVLNQQSLSTAAPSLDQQFAHQLSLASSKTDSQRRDAINYLTNTITERPDNLPLPVATILPKIQPLILDASNSVRAALTKLLRALPPAHVATHVDHMLLYVRAGMTHLAAEIRNSSLDVLEWLLQTAGQELVSCAGGWLKTLHCFLTLLGWHSTTQPGNWSSERAVSFGKPGSAASKLLIKQLNVLTMFLRAGFTDSAGPEQALANASCFPLCSTERQVLYARSNPFRGLNLFGAPKDAENAMYDDAEARKRAFDDAAVRAVARGIQAAKKEGGEIGRAASGLEKALVDGMGEFHRDAE
ncbi:rRNA processing protein Ipi1, partial [Aureobasidium melanogenum]